MNVPSIKATAASLAQLNKNAPTHGKIESLGSTAFGPSRSLQRFRLSNGLGILLLEDDSAPVLAYHTWYRVGSRHERPGKTGMAHLFEHLMFNETENLAKGEFDRVLERAGAESNASTWLDFTQYNIASPSAELPLLVKIEADRMQHLVLREPQLVSEKEVVANERRFRVDDDVEGTMNEELWKAAYTEHAYHWPTIGWMQDILNFTTEDCEEFYRSFYSPNNATVTIVGDFEVHETLRLIQAAYGEIPAQALPVEDIQPEPPQLEERRIELTKPSVGDKLSIGYKGPALGDADHVPLSLLCEILFGGRASRMYKLLVRDLEIATDVRMSVGPFHDPGLVDVYVSLRAGKSAESALELVDREFARVCQEPVSEAQIERARCRFELGMLHGLETAEGRAQTIGFYDCVLGRPAAAFERLEALRRVTASDLLRVARRYLIPTRRTMVIVRPSSADDAVTSKTSATDPPATNATSANKMEPE